MHQPTSLVNQLLWKYKSKWQITGAAVGGFIGLLLLLFALQVWFDVQYLLYGNKEADEYVTINKRVGLLNLLGARASFDEAEIKALQSQPFVKASGAYTPNQFKVSARSRSIGFYTELFFESVPDEFLDVETGKFQWTPGDNTLPIIMSKDYLSLYNFGFAISQGLPQLTPTTIQKVSLEITVYGNGKAGTFQGRIVGFSDRINSVLAPASFLNWANQQYGEGASDISRLILLVNNPGNPAFRQYLEDHNYEIGSGRLIGSRTAVLLNTLVSVIAFIGAIIVILSVMIFVLNFQLLISQSSADIRLLLQLGYKTGFLSNILIKKWVMLFGMVALVSVATLTVTRIYLVQYFSDQGIELPGFIHPMVYLAGVAAIAGIVFINIWNIRGSVAKLF